MNNDTSKKWVVLTFILSLVGALAWTPHVIDLLRPPKVQCRLVGWLKAESTTASKWNTWESKQDTLKGIFYAPRLSLTSLSKNINVSKVELVVKYPNDPKEYKGRAISVNKFETNIADSQGNTRKEVIQIPQEEQITMLTVIEEDRVQVVFVPFIVDKAKSEEWQYIEFIFHDFNNHKYTYKLFFSDIDWIALPSVTPYIINTPNDSTE